MSRVRTFACICQDRTRNLTETSHLTAIGIHLIYNCQFKILEFFEINSAIKGWGEAMVKAALNKLHQDWKAMLVMDWSDGFWDKMKEQHNHLAWWNI